MAERAEAAGLEVEGIIAEGHPAEEIIKYAEKNSIDLIVMGTLGKSGLERFLMGSVVDKVIRNSKIPVIVNFLKIIYRRYFNRKPDTFIGLEKTIGYTFRDTNILLQALSHRSYAFAQGKNKLMSNERLEFLGDALLGFTISDYLYKRYPKMGEGALSKLKSLIISRKILKTAADNIDLGAFMRLSESEEKSGGRKRASILSVSNSRSYVAPTMTAVVVDFFFTIGIWLAVWYLASHLSSMVRRREYELATINRRLVAAQKERSQYMLATTHQLKAPFAAIYSNAQLLLQGYCGQIPDQAAQAVQRIIIIRARVNTGRAPLISHPAKNVLM